MEEAGDGAKGMYALSEREKGVARIPMLLRFALIAGATVLAMVLASAAWERPLELADGAPAAEAPERSASPSPRCERTIPASLTTTSARPAAGSRGACLSP